MPVAAGTGTTTSHVRPGSVVRGGTTPSLHAEGHAIDQRAAIGTPVPFAPPSDSKVASAEITAGGDNPNSSSGIWREVSYYDKDGEYLGSERLMHLSQANYNVGDTVEPNTAIALTGDTGSPGQPHLHREVYGPDEWSVNPEAAEGVALRQQFGTQLGPNDSAGPGAEADPGQPAGPGAGGALGGAGGAIGAAGAAFGGAGCLGGGPSAPMASVAGGLLGNLGGIAQGALVSGAMAVLSGGGIQGAMGAMLGSAGGALGNSIGASLGGAAGAFVGQTLGGALGGIVAGQSPLQALSGSAFGALSSMGASLIPGLSNVLPGPLAQAAIQGLQGGLGALARGMPPGAAVQYALAGGLGGAISAYASNMTGNPTLGALSGAVASGVLTGQLNLYKQPSGQLNLLRYANTIAAVAATTSQNRNIVGAISEALSKGFGGSSISGYGAKVRNMQDMMTFSVSTLGQNINAVSADMIALGRWDASNLMRLMQPGNIAAQILNKGLGGYTGLTDQLTILNVPIAGVENPIFDRLTQQALNNINGEEEVNTIRTAFSMTTHLTNLGELTDFRKMMPTSFNFIPVENFRELGVHLAIIGINQSTTIYEIGRAFSKLETSSDLNYVNQSPHPMPTEVANQLLQIYGFGGGTYGEQTMADFIGTAAGYVHADTAPVIRATVDYISAHPAAETLSILTELLQNAMAGAYTFLGTAGDSSQGIPGEPGYISVPFPSGTVQFSSLDDVVYAFIPLIEAEHQALLNNTDPVLQDNLKKLDAAYSASCAQLVRESNNLLTHQIDLFSPIPPTPASAMMFAQALEGWALDTGYGRPAEYIERIASDDYYGDCVKFVMRHSRNGQALAGLGVDVEQFKLPHSQYYRDPEGFYESMYTGAFPPQPQNKLAPVYPRTPTDVYLNARNTRLEQMGYNDVPLQNNQKDEIFYDSLWSETNTGVLEDIGRQLVKTALDRNIEVMNDNMYIVDLDGNRILVAQIKDNGLILPNNDEFVLKMMQIVNRLLYGDILTTKYENPFSTDQMIWGVLELLAQVTNQNVEALSQTVTGGLIANGLLDKLIKRYGSARSLYDSSINRNDPVAYGGTGPDAQPL